MSHGPEDLDLATVKLGWAAVIAVWRENEPRFGRQAVYKDS